VSTTPTEVRGPRANQLPAWATPRPLRPVQLMLPYEPNGSATYGPGPDWFQRLLKPGEVRGG
jgi:hypothetical protein